jgi:hypothetical protein
MTTSNNNNGTSIMNFPFAELISTSQNFLSRFDDYQQMCADNGENEMTQFFVDSYNQLEEIIFNLKAEDVTDEIRNQIRSIVKETEKMACVQFSN